MLQKYKLTCAIRVVQSVDFEVIEKMSGESRWKIRIKKVEEENDAIDKVKWRNAVFEIREK